MKGVIIGVRVRQVGVWGKGGRGGVRHRGGDGGDGVSRVVVRGSLCVSEFGGRG